MTRKKKNKDFWRDIILIAALGIFFCCGYVVGYFDHDPVIDYSYSDDDLYEQRLVSMDIVAENFFPVHNHTVIITNEGYVSDKYDWENNTKLFDGGRLLRVNHSYYGVQYFLFDGWVLREYNCSVS